MDLPDQIANLQSQPTHGIIARVGYDSVAQWIRALPCGGRGRAFSRPRVATSREGGRAGYCVWPPF